MFRRGLILTGGPIYTMDPENPVARALMAFNGVIEYVGDALDLEAMGVDEGAGGWLRVIDLEGRAVIPGMVGGAVDLMGSARGLGSLDLHAVRDADELLRMLRFRIEGMSPGTWLLGRRLHRKLANKLPGLRERFDRLAPRNPVLLQGVRETWAAANSLALRVGAAQAIEAEAPEGIERKAGGIPTGIVRGRSLELLRAALPTPTQRRLDDLAENALRQWLSRGLTTVCDLGGCEAFGVLARLETRTRLPLRAITSILPGELQACLESGVCTGFGNGFLRRGGLLVDLAHGGEQAFEAGALLHRAVDAGFPLYFHAPRAQDVARALEIIAEVGSARGRHRILGVRAIAREELERLVSMQVAVSLQLDEEGDPLLESLPVEWLLQRGVHLGISSDVRDRGGAPLEAMMEMVSGGEEAGVDPEGTPMWGVRLEDVLFANIREEQWCLGQDLHLGRLAEGYRADLVILERDLFRDDPRGDPPRILGTACDGILRYEVPGWERG